MKVFIFGNDHTNTLGVAQSLGEAGLHPICCIWGRKTGILKSSRYVSEIIYSSTSASCLRSLIDEYGKEGGIIIPCSDEATYQLDNFQSELSFFKYEHVEGEYSIEWLLKKKNQVFLANKCGFDVPFSIEIGHIDEIPDGFPYPCLIKPLVSMEGGKAWTKVCENKEELISVCREALKSVSKLLLQEYISKDYDYVVLGCGLKDGSCILPGLIKKHKLFPAKTGLETVVTIDELHNRNLEYSIKSYIKRIGLVGLFSIEFVHTEDGKFYFVEINPRNDGVNQVVFKAGVNLPYIHYLDMTNNSFVIPHIRKIQMIWEMHHFMSLIRKDTGFKEWLQDIIHSDYWMVFSKHDMKPFFMQFYRLIGEKLRLLKQSTY